MAGRNFFGKKQLGYTQSPASIFFCVGAQAFVSFTEDRQGRKGKN